MKGSEYIPGLGLRNFITDYEQIIWFWNQVEKQWSKGKATKYFIGLMKQYGPKLLELEAFEVYAFLKDRATDAKMKRSEESKRKTEEKAQAEIKAFLIEGKSRRAIIDLINQIGTN